MFSAFVEQYGRPQASTAVELELLGLEHSVGLKQFSTEVGGGIFADGLLSLISVRERVDGLDAWQPWLPSGSRVFACSAFGFLMVTTGDDVWIVNTQYGEIMETDYSIQEAILQCAAKTTKDEILQSWLVEIWNEMAGPLPLDSVLCPTPAIALGGTWTATTLSAMTLPVYLSFTGQLFAPEGGMPANVHRLSDE
jgi:hypothetical protein